jgi:hypothetical protein
MDILIIHVLKQFWSFVELTWYLDNMLRLFWRDLRHDQYKECAEVLEGALGVHAVD